MFQIADAFALLKGEGVAGFDWRLVTASTNSPFEAVGEIVAMPGASEAVLAHAALTTHEAYQGLSDVLDGDEPPPVLESALLKRFLARNLNGVGLTKIEPVGEAYAPLNVTPQVATDALKAIQAPLPPISPRRARGTIEGFLVDAGQYYRQPALKLKERLRGRIIWCVIPPELEPRFAKDTSLRDVWQNSRVRIRGWIEYSAHGKLARVIAETISHVRPGEVSDRDLFDQSFTSGLGSVEYIDRLRDGDLG